MAIKINVTKNVFGQTVNVPNVYFKVGNIIGNKDTVRFDVNGTVDDNIVETKSYQFKPSMDGTNFVAQCYEHMKTLQEYEYGKDC